MKNNIVVKLSLFFYTVFIYLYYLFYLTLFIFVTVKIFNENYEFH